MRARTLDTPHGRVHIRPESPQLTAIQADTDDGAYYGQGYVAGRERLWQLELTRRVARGTTAELFGQRAEAADRFQRNLDLVSLARRECERDRHSEQAGHVEAYIAGVNRAIADRGLPPVELLVLGARPRPFAAEDAYLVGQLKYFINSAWKFELLFTLVAGRLPWRKLRALFATHTLDGERIAPLPAHRTDIDAATLAAIAAGSSGLARLGLESPDVGSNGFAVAGWRSRTGMPMLAADPHMGTVAPGFNMLFRLESGQGLDVVGSHFPGAPGIVIGRNRHIAWGMVGLMADNQDLFWGSIDGDTVVAHGRRERLYQRPSTLRVRGSRDRRHRAQGISTGRLVMRRGNAGLFLRWPALDRPLGTLTLHDVSRATNWTSFRSGLRQLHNAPMMAIYAAADGDIGAQAVGLIPRRRRDVGSLVRPLGDPDSDWYGYVDFDDLPREHNPARGYVCYANEYNDALLSDRTHVSNRWHPPSRARRVRELIEASPRHDAASLASIQDDLIDPFARDTVTWLEECMGMRPFGSWRGDTSDVAAALRFERFADAVVDRVVGSALADDPAGTALATSIVDQWPMIRWNAMDILRHHALEWGLDAGDVIRGALAAAQRPSPPHPRIEYRHALRRVPGAGALLGISHPYDGGSRETVHVARRTVDWTTARSTPSAGHDPGEAPFRFGPAFKLVFDLAPNGQTHYLANMPTSGTPFGLRLRRAMRRWRRRQRYALSTS